VAEARFDAIVIGAGVNGLTAAATLARAGRRVVVLESSDAIGGQARTVDFAPGFRAPLYDDAGWLPPAVAKGIGVDVPSIAPTVSVSTLHDGRVLSIPTDAGAAANVIRAHSSRDAAAWPGFTARLGKLSGFLAALYQAPAPDVAAASLAELAPLLGLGRRFRALGRDDMTELLRVLPMSVQDFLEDELETPWLRAAVGAGGVRDLRQGPRSGGTSFVLLHHLIGAPSGSVRARGWWTSGPEACVDAAAEAARTAGATIRTSARVASITVADETVTGVVLDGGEAIGAPLVLSTTDPATTLLRLVDPVWLDPELMLAVENIKFRACTAVVQFAVDRLPPEATVTPAALASVTSLSTDLDDIEHAYDAAKYGNVSPEPHVEITCPTMRWPSLAPPGMHIITARVQYVPRTPRDGAWSEDSDRDLADRVTARIGQAIPGFAETVQYRGIFTASDFAGHFGLTDGALTHGELTLDQILFMRPTPALGRYATPIAGLYLAGAGSHPGPGVIGGAGWLAARAALSSRAKVRS
jgi:phytoene dehydrogenase-like protein